MYCLNSIIPYSCYPHGHSETFQCRALYRDGTEARPPTEGGGRSRLSPDLKYLNRVRSIKLARLDQLISKVKTSLNSWHRYPNRRAMRVYVGDGFYL